MLWTKTKSLFHSYWLFQLFWCCWSPDSAFRSWNCLWFTALQWFWSYLLDRAQCVVVNNSASSCSPPFGVPQGSVLGPVLFVLYTTPFSDITANHSVNHQLFVDDISFKNWLHQMTYKALHTTCNHVQVTQIITVEQPLKLNRDETETPSLSSCRCLLAIINHCWYPQNCILEQS